MTAAQLAGFTAINLGSGLLTTDVLNVVASGNISALTMPTISNVETGNLTGTSGTDTVTLTGAQLDAILIGSGTINLGAGTGDTINLTSTSADLNTLGATDSSIQGVEAISASGAAAGVTINAGRPERSLHHHRQRPGRHHHRRGRRRHDRRRRGRRHDQHRQRPVRRRRIDPRRGQYRQRHA